MPIRYMAFNAGLGVGLLPCFVGDRDASLQRLGPDRPIVSRELWRVYHRDLKAGQRVIRLRHCIQERIHTHLTVQAGPKPSDRIA